MDQNERLWENFNEVGRSATLGYALYLQKMNPAICFRSKRKTSTH